MLLSVADLLLILVVIGSIGLLLDIVILDAVRKTRAVAEMILRAQQKTGQRRSGVVTRLSRNPLISGVASGGKEMEENAEDWDTVPLPVIDEP